ncbi:phage tail protein [Streptomyces chartreusis]|uniref:phage tail protein n=1 Tax=Streptomyces chartreusis TaxID=1969 RepID=UPI0036DD8130
MPEPYRANEFVVEIGTVESPSVSKVSGLSLGETDTIEVQEGGTNVVRKVSSGVVKFQPLTIERYVDGSQEDRNFKAFFEDMFKHGGGGGGSTTRRDGAVVKKHFGTEVFRITFYGAWVKSASFSDLEAGSANLLKQTVVLEHDGLEWIL